jgi:hypothetical protein
MERFLIIIILMRLSKINWRKIKGFVFQHRISAIIILVAIVLAIVTTWYMVGRNVSFAIPTLKTTPPKETRVPAPLTGELVDPAVVMNKPLAVVIENHPDARPQSGYNEADIVYETLAEGGITRTLAIFQSKESKEIGPVRSARPYFVDWLTSFGAIFAHIGGSVDALNLISQINTPDINQFANGNYYWRSTDRYAPHNVYSTSEKLYAAAKANNIITTSNVTSLKFKKDIPESERVAGQQVDIDFSYEDFLVSYLYDAKTNGYLRSIGGIAAKDKNTGIQISPKNVIVEFTSVEPYVNSEGAQAVRIGTTPLGSGYLFQDGKTIKINWVKPSRDMRTKYTDESGAEISLNPGQTWIEVVPIGNSVTY